jgi:hypothetical protein
MPVIVNKAANPIPAHARANHALQRCSLGCRENPVFFI